MRTVRRPTGLLEPSSLFTSLACSSARAGPRLKQLSGTAGHQTKNCKQNNFPTLFDVWAGERCASSFTLPICNHFPHIQSQNHLFFLYAWLFCFGYSLSIPNSLTHLTTQSVVGCSSGWIWKCTLRELEGSPGAGSAAGDDDLHCGAMKPCCGEVVEL